eukprot:4932235-Pleurochrysis_carterae.AAC.1
MSKGWRVLRERTSKGWRAPLAPWMVCPSWDSRGANVARRSGGRDAIALTRPRPARDEVCMPPNAFCHPVRRVCTCLDPVFSGSLFHFERMSAAVRK